MVVCLDCWSPTSGKATGASSTSIWVIDDLRDTVVAVDLASVVVNLTSAVDLTSVVVDLGVVGLVEVLPAVVCAEGVVLALLEMILNLVNDWVLSYTPFSVQVAIDSWLPALSE